MMKTEQFLVEKMLNLDPLTYRYYSSLTNIALIIALNMKKDTGLKSWILKNTFNVWGKLSIQELDVLYMQFVRAGLNKSIKVKGVDITTSELRELLDDYYTKLMHEVISRVNQDGWGLEDFDGD